MRLMRVLLIIAAVLAGLVLLGFIAFHMGIYPAAPAHKGVVALIRARVIDGTGAPPIEEAMILIRDGRIVAVGPADEIPIPEGAQVLKLRGLTVLPGLIDSHVHFGAPEVERFEDYQKLSVPALIWDAMRMHPGKRRAFIEHGVTAIKSVGDPYPWIIEVKRAIEGGKLEGPRVFAAGPGFTAPGGHPAGTIFKDNPYLIRTATRQMTDPERAREEVRSLAQGRVDFIKALYDGGSERSPFGLLPKLDRAVLKAIIEEAHAQGLKVTVHWSHIRELVEIVDLGMDGLEHAGVEELPESLVQEIAARGIWVTPTLAVFERLFPPAVLEVAKRNVRKLREAGVKIAAGTDAGNPGVLFGPSLHRELELLVEAGLTPMEAILAATKNAAELLGMEELGTLEPGKLADLIAVEGNPLRDISTIRDIRLVIKGGKVLVNRLHEARRSFAVTETSLEEPEAAQQTTQPEPPIEETPEPLKAAVERSLPGPKTIQEVRAFIIQAQRLYYNPASGEEFRRAKELLEAAERGLKALLERNPADAVAWHELAKVQYALGSYLEIEVEEWAVKADKHKARRYFEAAWESAQRAVELDGKLSDAHRLVGEAIMRLISHKGWRFAAANSKKAKEAVEKALRLNAANTLAHLALGQWYFFTPGIYGGDLRKARRSFERALEAAKTDHERFLAQIWLGQVLLTQGDKAQAKEHFERALEIYPNSRWAKALLEETHE